MSHEPTDKDWANAKWVCRLSDDEVRMAKELGFKPWSLTKSIPSPHQRWKLPVSDWIRAEWAKRHPGPDFAQGYSVDPVELAVSNRSSAHLREQDQLALRKQARYREAAERIGYVASQVEWIDRLELFGSVAESLPRDKPRFRWRDARFPLHEVANINLAVWVTDLSQLDVLRHLISDLLQLMSIEKPMEPGVPHYAIDLFIMQAHDSHYRYRYRGRLCHYGKCPRMDKEACLTPGCGAQPFLLQLKNFEFNYLKVFDRNAVVLFDRESVGWVEKPQYPPQAETRLKIRPVSDED